MGGSAQCFNKGEGRGGAPAAVWPVPPCLCGTVIVELPLASCCCCAAVPSCCYSAAAVLLQWIPPHERARAVSLTTSGEQQRQQQQRRQRRRWRREQQSQSSSRTGMGTEVVAAAAAAGGPAAATGITARAAQGCCTFSQMSLLCLPSQLSAANSTVHSLLLPVPVHNCPPSPPTSRVSTGCPPPPVHRHVPWFCCCHVGAAVRVCCLWSR